MNLSSSSRSYSFRIAVGSLMLGIALTPSGTPSASVLWPTQGTPVRTASLPASGQTAFIENRGQWDLQARFLARAPGSDIWITDSGIVYDTYRLTASSPQGVESKSPSAIEPLRSRRGHVVCMEFVGAHPGPTIGEERLSGSLNYFLGKDPARWSTGVPRYAGAKRQSLYDGVSVRFYFTGDRPRYDLIVEPGADPRQILMRFDGALGIETNGKALSIGTSVGTLEQRGLFAYQNTNGGVRQVPCGFQVRGRLVTFALGQYDVSRPLVIDPLLWSTFIGGAGTDECRAVKLDTEGNPVVAGYTSSANFPTTTGAYDVSFNAVNDCFVAKFTADGSGLTFASYVGGSLSDVGISLDLDSQNQPVVGGYTSSTNFPATVGAFDPTHNGQVDMFLLKLTTDGSALSFATYLGSSHNDYCYGVAVDSADRPVFAGYNQLGGFPTSVGAYDRSTNGSYDFAVGKLASDGTALVWSTYIGGTGEDAGGFGLVLDSSDRPYICGYSFSDDFPVTAGSDSPGSDAVIAKLSANGQALLAARFLGGDGADYAQGLCLDPLSGVWVTGKTNSGDFPVSVVSTGAGLFEAFVTKLSQVDLSTVLASTCLAGSSDDEGLYVAVDSFGFPIVGGVTRSTDFPVTSTGYSDLASGNADMFLVKLYPSVTSVLYGTYLGTDGTDRLWSGALDAQGHMVICGSTTSASFPTTTGAFDSTYGGGATDGTLSRIATAPVPYRAEFATDKVVVGFSVQFTITLTQPVPADALISVSTDTPGKVFPAPVAKVRKGQNTKAISVPTETVKLETLVTIFAQYNGVTKSDTIALLPGGLASIRLDGTTIGSGTIGSGSVQLSGQAQKDRVVRLSSSDAAALVVGASVTVSAGVTTGVFSIEAGSVAVNTNVTVKAVLGTMTKTDTITVTP